MTIFSVDILFWHSERSRISTALLFVVQDYVSPSKIRQSVSMLSVRGRLRGSWGFLLLRYIWRAAISRPQDRNPILYKHFTNYAVRIRKRGKLILLKAVLTAITGFLWRCDFAAIFVQNRKNDPDFLQFLWQYAILVWHKFTPANRQEKRHVWF